MASTQPDCGHVTSRQVAFLLRRYDLIRERVQLLTGQPPEVVGRSQGGGSPTEALALRRAVITWLLDELQDAVNRLPPRHRRLIRLYYRDGLPSISAARRLADSERGFHRTKSRILGRLAAELSTLPQSRLAEFWRGLAPLLGLRSWQT